MSESTELEDGIALCLSGGGYRAMIFHVGAVKRLNEFGYLPKLERISSVSGGSITAAILASCWDTLQFDQNGVASNLDLLFTEKVFGVADRTIDIPTVIKGVLLPGKTGNHLAAAYKKHIFGSTTLQNLPEHPRFVINSANLLSGVLWRFSRPYMGDYKTGRVFDPQTELATAVAASSAFPPFLAPLELNCSPIPDREGAKATARSLRLADGGMYDNMGFETVWKRYKTVIVSDGGGFMGEKDHICSDWFSLLFRTFDITDNQVRALRRITMMAGFEDEDPQSKHEGTYWSMKTNVDAYKAPGSLPCPTKKTLKLAAISTRFKKMDDKTKKKLVNFGYALCDAAMRRYVDRSLPTPSGFPYPEEGV